MLVIKGTVIGVADKGEGDKRWAIIAIQSTAKDRDGFDITTTEKIRVFGENIKTGIQNAYRSHIGVEVYAPVVAEVNDRYKKVDYSIAGLPLKVQEVTDKAKV